MVVHSSVSSNLDEWRNSLEVTLALIPEAVEEELLDAATEIAEPRLVQIAETAKPRNDSKFIWSHNAQKNRKAQAWWFANLAKGNIPTDGRHYQRQGKPPYGLDIDVNNDSGELSLTIFSTWKKFNLVFGSPLTGRGQLPGHNTTEWNVSKQEVDELLFDINVYVIDRVNERVETSFKSGSRRR